jgi:Uma2 family endonuclease
MATITEHPHVLPAAASADASEHRDRVVLEGISWETYEALLEDLAEEHFILTYDNGTLEIMAPAPRHDRAGYMLARLVGAFTEVRNIPIAGFGGTTWRRKDRRKGLEADECFYIRSEPLVRGREDIDLANDPPPDLAIEVENTRSSLNKQGIYAALGVAELWRYLKERLTVHVLQPDGTYAISTVSPSFPDLPLSEIERFMHQRHGTSETEWVRSFRDWVAQRYRP